MSRRPKSRFTIRIETSLAGGAAWLFRLLPHRAALRLGSGLAVLIHDLTHIRVKVAIDNLLRSFPDSDKRWARRIVRRSYAHFGAVTAELARLPVLIKGSFDRWIVEEDGSSIELTQAVEGGRGGFVVSGHLGNWEMAGAWAAWKGFPITYVVARQSNPLVEELIDRHRRSAGIEIIKRDDAARGIVDALRRGRLVAMMIDQDARRDGIFIDFFGRPASTFRGVGTFAVKYRPKVISMETWRDKQGRVHFCLTDVPIPDTGDRDADSRALLAELTGRLEGYIRRHPEQWLWLHRRWKTKP